MKNALLLAVLTLGAGVATTRADVAFGIPVDHGRPQPYAGSAYGSAPAYAQAPLPGHPSLHRVVREARHEFERDLRAQKAAINRAFDQQRASGVPEWQVRPQREQANRQIKAIRRAGIQNLKEAHKAGHDVLRQEPSW